MLVVTVAGRSGVGRSGVGLCVVVTVGDRNFTLLGGLEAMVDCETSSGSHEGVSG